MTMADEEKKEGEEQAEASSVEFDDLEPDSSGEKNITLDLIMDISLPVSVRLGQTTMTVRRLLELAKGAVIELDKMAGEPVDLYVRDVPFARGEVVVVQNHFGIRITEIVDREKRLKHLSGE